MVDKKLHLNIGCGPKSRWVEDTIGLDIIDFGQEYVGDILNIEIKEKFDVIYIHHVIEHVNEQVKLFNKLGSLLNKDGILDIRVPTLPYIHAFVDPTHVKFIPKEVEIYFGYFTKNSLAGHCYSDYEFEIISVDRDRYEWEAHIIMKLN